MYKQSVVIDSVIVKTEYVVVSTSFERIWTFGRHLADFVTDCNGSHRRSPGNCGGRYNYDDWQRCMHAGESRVWRRDPCPNAFSLRPLMMIGCSSEALCVFDCPRLSTIDRHVTPILMFVLFLCFQLRRAQSIRVVCCML